MASKPTLASRSLEPSSVPAFAFMGFAAATTTCRLCNTSKCSTQARTTTLGHRRFQTTSPSSLNTATTGRALISGAIGRGPLVQVQAKRGSEHGNIRVARVLLHIFSVAKRYFSLSGFLGGGRLVGIFIQQLMVQYVHIVVFERWLPQGQKRRAWDPCGQYCVWQYLVR